MSAPQRARHELLQGAARLFERNLITTGTTRYQLVHKAQQHRFVGGTDITYLACIKNQYKGAEVMPRLWEDVLRLARAGELEMADFAQSRLTRVLAEVRPEVAEILGQLSAAASRAGAARTTYLRTAADTLVRKSEKSPAVRGLAPRSRSAPSSMGLDSAALAWVLIFDACIAPEPGDAGSAIPDERAGIALEALERGASCDQEHRRAIGPRARVGFPSPRVEAACGAGTWVAARAVLAMCQRSENPLAVARSWAVDHDGWLRPQDESGMSAQIAQTLFEHGRTGDALRALEMACLRNDPLPVPGLVEVGIALCTAMLADGNSEGASRAIPPVLRTLLDNPEWVRHAGPDVDVALSEALRQALVDPRLGLTALRRVWFANYRDEPSDSSTGWLVTGALAWCLRATGTPAEAGTVAALSRRLLDEPGNEQAQRIRTGLIAEEVPDAEVPLAAERQRLHSLLDELEALLLRSPQLASDERMVRELTGIAKVARRARLLVRPERNARV